MPSRLELANAIRFLSMDAVQAARSGHPGMPMGMADIAQVLWGDFLRHHPSEPSWINRDRFILSNGHGSMLLYSLLHLTGYDLGLAELKNFRQLHSKTPGHPEYGCAPGVETTTGPLGQGIANGVGMAIAETQLAASFNQPNLELINHYTYVFAGDGCLMEGISHEACSFAGTLGLGKLIVFYDDNHISIDGQTAGWFTDDTPARFAAYNWHVIPTVDGHDPKAIKQAIEQARAQTQQPTLICCQTIIGFGAPNLAGSEKTHGAPLGVDEVAATRQTLAWDYAPFEIPDNYYAAWDGRKKGAQLLADWLSTWEAYQKNHPVLAREFKRRITEQLPDNWSSLRDNFIKSAANKRESMATRQASQYCLNQLGPILPELLGGSADLTHSNNTNWSGSITLGRNKPGNYIHYGVREFGMAAMMNGMALHGGVIPYGGTFLVFTDYMRNALRLSALAKQRVIYVLTHDSIGLGEDGPTHQPIEHAAMLRLTPNMSVWRPADVTETAVAWAHALERTVGPTSLLLSRQTLPHIERTTAQIDLINCGGYILRDSAKIPELILIATGSEVSIALQAWEKLSEQGHALRLVSMPCVNRFLQQSEEYQALVLPQNITHRIAIEAAASDYWYRFVGLSGRVIGLHNYGESAPAEAIYKDRGITVDAIINTAIDLL